MKKSHIAAPHGASVSRRHRLYENEDVPWISNKRPSLLRRHMVNNVVATDEKYQLVVQSEIPTGCSIHNRRN